MRHIRYDTIDEVYEENENVFADYEFDVQDVPSFVTYSIYNAVCCYYVEKYSEGSRWINRLLNEVSLKKYPLEMLEIKIMLALLYCLMRDYDLFNQLINSIQRHIRLVGKEKCEHILIMSKILKVSISEKRKNKEQKIKSLLEKMDDEIKTNHFTPLNMIRKDEDFIDRLTV